MVPLWTANQEDLSLNLAYTGGILLGSTYATVMFFDVSAASKAMEIVVYKLQMGFINCNLGLPQSR